MKFRAPHLLRLLCWASMAVFAGRAWQHLAWEGPYTNLLWDETVMAGPVHRILNLTWQEYAASPRVLACIQGLSTFAGLAFATGFFVLLLSQKDESMRRARKLLRPFIAALAAGLFTLACIEFRRTGFQWGMLIELSCQVLSPVLWLLATRNSRAALRGPTSTRAPAVESLARWAVALTFLGHGLYAFGYYPVPGIFIDMCIRVLGVSESQARVVLGIAGVLDFLVAFMALWPAAWRQRWRAAYSTVMAYAVLWGFATASARVVAGWDSRFVWDSIAQGGSETLFRLPHGLIPLYLWLTFLTENSTELIYRQKSGPSEFSEPATSKI